MFIKFKVQKYELSYVDENINIHQIEQAIHGPIIKYRYICHKYQCNLDHFRKN